MMNYNVSKFDDALINNPAPRCACMLVLDGSTSMRGDRINALNRGVIQFIEELKSDEVAAGSIELGVTLFNCNAQFIQPFTAIEDIVAINQVEANGNTAMGAGVELAIHELESRKQQYQQNGVSYYQPWLILMTDGEPNDDWRQAAARLRQLSSNKKVVVLCIGIGETSDMQVLSEFSVLPPKKLAGLKFDEFFQWLSQSMQRVSSSTPGDKINLPPTGSWDSIDV